MVVGWASEAGEGFFEQTARTGNGQQQEQRQERQRCRLKMCDRFWWVKARRGPSTAQLAKGASCFAQDDGFSGGVGKNRQRQVQRRNTGDGGFKVEAQLVRVYLRTGTSIGRS